MIDLATEFLNFVKFDQSVFEFDYLALRKSLSHFHILRFISFVINGRINGRNVFRFSSSVWDIII